MIRQTFTVSLLLFLILLYYFFRNIDKKKFSLDYIIFIKYLKFEYYKKIYIYIFKSFYI